MFVYSRKRLYNSIFAVQEIRRIKPVPKLACHSVASWCHPRAPNLDILTCVKDSHIWYDIFFVFGKKHQFVVILYNDEEKFRA